MPKLLYSIETLGCGATIELDSGEVCMISVAQAGVLVRSYRKGQFLGSFFGAKLYNEKSVYAAAKTAMALSGRFPERDGLPDFKNPVLDSFAMAVWHCSSAAQATVLLNEATISA